MSDRAVCRECEAIAEELAQAYADAWASTDPETKTAWISVHRMIGGTEQDAARAEEFVRNFEIREALPAKIEEAYFRDHLAKYFKENSPTKLTRGTEYPSHPNKEQQVDRGEAEAPAHAKGPLEWTGEC